MKEEASVVLRCSSSDPAFDYTPYFDYLERVFDSHFPYSLEDRNEYNFWDYLQNPLQPLR